MLVADLLAGLSELYEIHFKAKGIACSFSTGPENMVISADEAQLKQVLINLLKNAIEALEAVENPCIEVSVKRILYQVSIEIHNNGPAIAPDVMDKIFVPFYTTKPEGSGIGLSLSRQIVGNHGGQMAVDSEEGKGTTFKILLPVLN